MLPKSWNVRLVNRNTEELAESDLDWADMVMTGGMLFQQSDTLELIEMCRARGLPVVIGGPDATSSPHRYETANFRVLGEVEDIITRIHRGLGRRAIAKARSWPRNSRSTSPKRRYRASIC